MVQKKARHPFKDEAERRFPHKVDVPVLDTGLGRDLTAMLEWCRARVPQPGWAYHGHTGAAEQAGAARRLAAGGRCGIMACCMSSLDGVKND